MYIISKLPEHQNVPGDDKDKANDKDEASQGGDVVFARSQSLTGKDFWHKTSKSLLHLPNRSEKPRTKINWTPMLVIMALWMILHAVFPSAPNSSSDNTREVQVRVGGWIGLMVKNTSSAKTSTKSPADSHSMRTSPRHKTQHHNHHRHKSIHPAKRRCHCSR